MADLNVNEARIRAMIEGLAQFTATPGAGTTRLTYSEEHRGARAFLLEQMEKAGLVTREDAVGNLFGRIEGQRPDLAPVLVGSHFDSVPNGGAFDGPAGVVAGIETAFVFQDLGLRPERPVEIIAMIEEEGSRFGGGLFGSRLLTGQVGQADLDTMADHDGVSVAQAMRAFGLDPEKAADVALAEGAVHAFLELHIEQGPVLEESADDVAFVTEIVSLTQLEVTLTGAAGHAGTTPMTGRKDAFVAASGIIAGLPELVAGIDPSAVATVGRMSVAPGGANVIPNHVSFSVDIRAAKKEIVARIVAALKERLAALDAGGIGHSVAEAIFIPETPMSDAVFDAFAASADAAGIRWRRMPSGAGHDAMILSAITQTGLVFVPSRDGISHAPEEWTDYADLALGVEVIFRATRRIAGA
ncbi:Zn-dependent hydrolase (plasmid) [Roseivivax marinus]|nr:Zn-dependent hydrolase [Roseivivax marinus]UMA67097.1 Zn-dependent hydrolase [Roseivivax marinus]